MFIPALLLTLVTLPATPATGVQTVIETPVTLTTTATIESVDPTSRAITLKFDDGSTDTLIAGPRVTRFDQLKAGDKIKFHYYESIAYQVRKAGSPEPPSSDSEKAFLTPSETGPGGEVSKQRRETVTVVKVDPTQGSITVKASNGNVTSRRVKDKTKLTGIAAGDRIEILYTAALITTVEPGT